jgi:hypothetical protein
MLAVAVSVLSVLGFGVLAVARIMRELAALDDFGWLRSSHDQDPAGPDSCPGK